MKYFKISLLFIIVIFYTSITLASTERYEIYAYFPSKWSSNQIPICWENPSRSNEEGRNWTKEAITETWERHSALKFVGWDKCHNRSSGLRILIDDYGPHTKGLGNQLDGRKNGMTLNFTFNNWNRSCRRSLYFCVKVIAVHEFGHALGFAHEQNRPDAPSECQQEGQGGDGDVYLSDYDPNSVMNYCNPEWSGGGKLSRKDIQGLQKWYGKPSTQTVITELPVTKPVIEPTPLVVSKETNKPKWCQSSNLKRVEKLICNTPELWKVESKNIALFTQLYNSITNATDKHILSQNLAQWLKQRDFFCLFSVNICLQIYQQRIASLEKLVADNQPQPVTPPTPIPPKTIVPPPAVLQPTPTPPIIITPPPTSPKTIVQPPQPTIVQPPSVPRPSWCRSSRLNQAEKVICNNDVLWELDNTNVVVYKQLRSTASRYERRKLSREVGRWLKQRNNECLRSINACIQVYQERITDLESRL